MKIPPPPWWIIPILLALCAAFKFDPAKSSPIPIRTTTFSASGCGEHTADWWFKTAILIQNNIHELAADERRFINDVVNRLAVSEYAMPTPAHQEWLCNLKRRLKL